MKTAFELGITEEQRRALVLVLDKLESGEIVHASAPYSDSLTRVKGGAWFNMNWWDTGWAHEINRNCGTVHCIGGWAEKLSNVEFSLSRCDNPQLELLFYCGHLKGGSMNDVTTEQAARALRNYLETGKSRWEEVLNVNG